MTVQDFSITILQNQLGRIIPNPIVRPIVVGYFQNVASTALGYIQTVNDGNLGNLGLGQGTEWAKFCLDSNLPSVDILPVAQDPTDGYSVAPFVVAGNLSGNVSGVTVPTLTPASTGPVDSYQIRVEIQGQSNQVIGASTGTVQFRYSLDDGNTWIATTTYSGVTGTPVALYCTGTANNSPVSSGLTIVFPAGTYVPGDVFNSYCFPSALLSTAFTGSGTQTSGAPLNLFTAIQNSGKKYTHVIFANSVQTAIPTNSVTGPAADNTNITAQATYIAAIKTGVDNLAVAGLPTVAVVEIPRRMPVSNALTSGMFSDELDVTYQNMVDGYVTSNDKRLCIGYGHIAHQSTLQNVLQWRSTAYSFMGRVIRNNNLSLSVYTSDPVDVVVPNTSLKFTINNYNTILQTGSTYDESKSTNTIGGVHGAVTPLGFLALYTSPYAASSSTYEFLAGNTHTDESNDFFEYLYLAQFNELTNVINSAMYQHYKGIELQTKKDGSGNLTEAQCRDIESTIQNIVNTLLVQPGHIPATPANTGKNLSTFVTVTRNWNVVSTSTLTYTYRMWVNAYAKFFSATGSLAL